MEVNNNHELIIKTQKITNRTDSIFDATRHDDYNQHRNHRKGTMFWSRLRTFFTPEREVKVTEKAPFMGGRKCIEYDELVKMYFSLKEAEDDGIGHESLCEIISTYWPLLGLTRAQVEVKIASISSSQHTNNQFLLFPFVLERKEAELSECFESFFGFDLRGGFEICQSRQRNGRYQQVELNNFLFNGSANVKETCFILSRLEVEAFSKLDILEFFGPSGVRISRFIGLFNRLTAVMISAILECQGRVERKGIIKRILKMAREFERLGVMNCVNSCVMALEASCIHRLEGRLSDQTKKYQQRHFELLELISPKGNFKKQRQTACLTPWLGIILRDFNFIKEMSGGVKTVNLPLSLCLKDLVRQVSLVRESCNRIMANEEEEDEDYNRQIVSLLENCLLKCSIEYEDEESQNMRSMDIQA
jgi:hypothetical protein